MIQLTVFIIPSMMHHQRTISNDSDDKIDHNYDQYKNNWSNKYNSVLAVYKFCCNCFRANGNCKEQRNTDTTALISYWIKLTKNFCKFYMVAKKVNCSRNPFEKFQTRLNWRVLGILMWYSTCPLHRTRGKAETNRSMADIWKDMFFWNIARIANAVQVTIWL